MAKAKSKPARGGRRTAAPTKDETVEVNEGGQLLLGNLPSNKDAKMRYETLKDLMARSRKAAKKVTDYKNTMKAEGFDVQAFVDTMALEKSDPLDVAAYFKEMARMMSVLGMPVQMELYEPKYKSPEEQADKEGYNDGYNRRSPNAQRWPEDGPSHDVYMAAWQKGQKATIMGEKSEETEH